MYRARSYALTLILLTICATVSRAQQQQQGQPSLVRSSPAERAATELPGASLRTQTAEEINNAGCLSMDARQYEKAIEQFKLAISLKPQLFFAGRRQ
jgi:hypothetical protein